MPASELTGTEMMRSMPDSTIIEEYRRIRIDIIWLPDTTPTTETLRFHRYFVALKEEMEVRGLFYCV